ncbi:hypothetical protein FHS94_002274 [Sphingomonas aerophila]|uniref:Uncharacterized protein n=1 Tax=Sphingomonas aerophila TaxID=1344948 RepID=A0A7W9BDY8_9SPHN|nr:hypothetical protein [Sphingomonas aerophila]
MVERPQEFACLCGFGAPASQMCCGAPMYPVGQRPWDSPAALATAASPATPEADAIGDLFRWAA